MQDYFIADDLSGALDAAAGFHHAGRAVRIAVTENAWPTSRPGEVLAVTSETRNATAAVAAATVRRVLTEARARRGRLRYKKIDSTLRGPVAAELRVLLEMLPDVRVLFAPANPAAGRTVRNGVLLVNGVPVAETDFGRDPAAPLRTSAVRELLGDLVGHRVSIPDTETAEDLAAAARRMDAMGGNWLGVGSGALLKAIAVGESKADLPPPALAVPESPILMLGGSAHPLNREQADWVARAEGVAPHEVSTGGPARLDPALGDLRTKRVAIVRLSGERLSPATALRTIVEAGGQLIATGGVRRVFATGGETAFALCERLGIEALEYGEEIEPGLALASGVSRLGPVRLAVKPGGFGNKQTWARALARLRQP